MKALFLITVFLSSSGLQSASPWQPIGLSGGGGLFAPAISPVDPNLMFVNCDMSGAYLSEDGGRNWRMIHHAQLRSDTACRPAFHPTDRRIIFASSGGRLCKSTDRGQTFQPVGDLKEGLYGEIRINPLDPRQVIVGTRAGHCFVSSDEGVSWRQANGPGGEFFGFHFDQSRGGKSIFAASNKGLWRSEDDGSTWSDVAVPSREIQGFAAGSNKDRVVLYCSVRSSVENGELRGGVFRSDDRGETWRWAMGQGINKDTRKADEYGLGPVAQYHQLLVADAAPLTVYALNTCTGFHPPHHETVYRSDDGGESWRATYYQDPRFKEFNVAPDYEVASTGQSFKGGGVPFGVAICNSDPDRVLLAMNEVHITSNGGQSWYNGSTYAVPGTPAGPGAAWVCNGQVVTTTWHYYVDPHESNRHYIAYTDIGVARSLDAGKSWIWWDKKSWAPWRNTCYELAFDPAKPGLIWGAFSNVHDIPNDNIISEHHSSRGPGGVCVSRDFGASWKTETQGLPLKPVTSVVIDTRSPEEARVLYAGLFDGGVFKSFDSGKTWAAKSSGLGFALNMRVSRVFLHNDGTLFAAICGKRLARGEPLMREGAGLYRSQDGAENWEAIGWSGWRYVKDFSVDPRDSKRVLVGVCDAGRGDKAGGLYATSDGGDTWKQIGREGPQTFGGYFHPRQRDWIYMTLTEGAPGAGLWLSKDNGGSWQPFNALPFANIQRVEFDPANSEMIYATTFGGSIWNGPAEPR